MRLILPFVLLSLFITPVFANMDDSDSNYNSDDWRVAKAIKLINKERFETAADQLRKALKKDDKNADAWNLLGFASRKMGDLDTSADAYSRALALEPTHKGALEYQGELFITQGTIDKAKENLEKLIELCPNGCNERTTLEKALARLQ